MLKNRYDIPLVYGMKPISWGSWSVSVRVHWLLATSYAINMSNYKALNFNVISNVSFETEIKLQVGILPKL